MPRRTFEHILGDYVYAGDWGEIEFDPLDEWTTDDLIELGVVINNILKDRDG